MDARARAAAALLFLAASAQAGNGPPTIDFSDPTARAVKIFAEVTPCVNQNPPAGVSAADPGCTVFAADATAAFSPTFFPGTLENLGATSWRLTVEAATWEAVVQSALGASNCVDQDGICTGTMTDLAMEFDSSQTGTDVHAVNGGTGGVPPNPLVYWQAKFFSTDVGELDVGAQELDADRPFYGDIVGDPYIISCAGTGIPSPTGSLCALPLETEPGLTPSGANGTTVTAFAMTFNGICRQVYAPLDWRLEEVPEPGRALLLLGGAITMLALARAKR
jgi:hypothetical protein